MDDKNEKKTESNKVDSAGKERPASPNVSDRVQNSDKNVKVNDPHHGGQNKPSDSNDSKE